MSSREAIAPLVTRGPVIDLGLYKNIVHKGDTSQDLFWDFAFILTPHSANDPQSSERIHPRRSK